MADEPLRRFILFTCGGHTYAFLFDPHRTAEVERLLGEMVMDETNNFDWESFDCVLRMIRMTFGESG